MHLSGRKQVKYQKILENEEYKKYLEKICYLEKDRIYCKHDLIHSLDVARICTIMMYEQGKAVSRDIVYASALLHDIGRFKENTENHEALSVDIAKNILPVCGYTNSEISDIVEIISFHRGNYSIKQIDELVMLGKLDLKESFRIADQLSRNCFCCKASSSCKWKEENKSTNIMM